MYPYLEEFKNHLLLENLKLGYYFRIKTYLKYCQNNGIKVEEPTYDDIQNYFIELRKTRCPGGTNFDRLALRKFYKFLIACNKSPQASYDTIAKFKQAKTTQKIRDVISKEELGDIIEMAESFVEYMDPIKLRALLYFLFYTGLRKSEVIRLKRSDINLDERSVIVREPKNRQERKVFYPKRIYATRERQSVDLSMILADYFAIEEEVNGAFNMTHNVFQHLIENLKDFAPRKNLTIHTFRHSFCRMLAKEGVDCRVAQKLLGHKNIQSTMIYYDPDIDSVEKIYREKVR